MREGVQSKSVQKRFEFFCELAFSSGINPGKEIVESLKLSGREYSNLGLLSLFLAGFAFTLKPFLSWIVVIILFVCLKLMFSILLYLFFYRKRYDIFS